MHAQSRLSLLNFFLSGFLLMGLAVGKIAHGSPLPVTDSKLNAISTIERAEERTEESEEENPEERAAEAALIEGRYEDALQLYTTLSTGPATNDAQRNRALTRLAHIHLRLGHDDIALELIEQALAIPPDTGEEHQLAGDIHCYKGQRSSMFKALKLAKKCIQHYERSVELSPDNPTGLLAAAKFLLEAPGIAGGDEARGEQYLQMLKPVSPEHYDTYRVDRLLSAGETEAAIQLADTLLSHGLTVRENQLALANVYIRQYQQKNGDRKPATAELTGLEKGSLEKGSLEKASQLLLAIIQGNDDYDSRWILHRSHCLLGENLLALNQAEKALPHLDTFVANNPNHTDGDYLSCQWSLAKAYYATGQKTQFASEVENIRNSEYRQHKAFAKNFEKELKDIR